MIEIVVHFLHELFRGDPAKRAYKTAWIQNPQARGERAQLEVLLELEQVPGRDRADLSQPLRLAFDDWANLVPPKQMRHRSGRRWL
ncbi:hypothetical protein [Aeromicrobium sp.]|uniref:hypothetical protein n=1 Tax=Aeromicrobium sp. TaxID=1871063 RepID=UPI0025BCC869|nr:hypothetical protein [Aeromicrobium sp.]MCK5892707.1 hypothetical protein [Aeromicrobium sp.]